MSDFPDDTGTPAARAAAYHTVAAALARLQAGEPLPLAALAAAAGLSETHFQRVFTRWAGPSPKRFLQHLARERALAALAADQDLLTASLAAGLSGPGRLHDLLVRCEAATPGEVRSGGAGLAITAGIAATPFGPAFLATSARGLMALSFLEEAGSGPEAEARSQPAIDLPSFPATWVQGPADLAASRHASPGESRDNARDATAAFMALQAAWPRATLRRDDPAAAALATRIFTRYRAPEPLTLFLRGTPFQLKVWEALLRVPDGRLVTYGTLAAGIGQPAASRAVGSAVGANPIALLIPCHRVIRASGVLGGYRWGEARKRLLVGLELAGASPEQAAPE